MIFDGDCFEGFMCSEKESGASCTAALFSLFVIYTRVLLRLSSLCFFLVLSRVVHGLREVSNPPLSYINSFSFISLVVGGTGLLFCGEVVIF